MKKNIGIVVDNDFYNDIRVTNQAKILAEKYNVFVLCFEFKTTVSGRIDPSSTNLDINVSKIKIHKKIKNILFGIQNTIPIYDYFWAYHIQKFVKKNSLISIHVHDLFLSKAGCIAKKKTNAKMILDLHENYPVAVLNYKWTQHFLKQILAKPHLWAKKEEKLLSYPDLLIVLSEYYKKKLQDNYSFLFNQNIMVFPNVPDITTMNSYPIHKNIIDKKNKFIVFYFGIISTRRGIDLLINAIKSLLPKYPDIFLLLIGPVDKAETFLFTKYFQETFIKHIDWIDISLFPSYMNISDICINPIIKDEQTESGIANKVIQYALFGKPIIVSDCKPQAEFVKENQCGLVFSAENDVDLVEKIEFLINNPKLCRDFGENGLNAVKNKYNIDSIKNRLFERYDAFH
ncbi:MAG: glycosyltransferase [Candidatus Cloacimonetes bacterium]|nr:glycosyltransferase [Candidatus Cloacimonadota bacterium]